jgi:hypothetical protein
MTSGSHFVTRVAPIRFFGLPIVVFFDVSYSVVVEKARFRFVRYRGCAEATRGRCGVVGRRGETRRRAAFA